MSAIAPVLGVLTATGIYLSPAMQIIDIFLQKTPISPSLVQNLNPISFSVMPCNALTWTMYSLLPAMKDPYVFWSNIIGWPLSLFYFAIVFGVFQGLNVPEAKTSFSVKRLQEPRILMLVLFLSGQFLILICSYFAFIQVYTGSAQNPDFASKQIMGLCSIAILVVFYAAPLSALMKVIKSRDASLFNTPLLIASFINACLWTYYGYFGLQNPDVYIWGPNSIGVFVSIAQLMCKTAFRNSVKENNSPAEYLEYPDIESAQPIILTPGSQSSLNKRPSSE